MAVIAWLEQREVDEGGATVPGKKLIPIGSAVEQCFNPSEKSKKEKTEKEKERFEAARGFYSVQKPVVEVPRRLQQELLDQFTHGKLLLG